MTAAFDLCHFQRRLLVDAMNEATAVYWRRRAMSFEAAVPRPGDYMGAATPEQVMERADSLRAKAQACRNRAELCELTETEELLIIDMLAESFTTANVEAVAS